MIFYSLSKIWKAFHIKDSVTIQNILVYTSKIASDFFLSFEEMQFGGTEQEILGRGTDWCADMARVAVVLLNCLKIPARILHLVNLKKAYNGHVIVEAFYEGNWGVIDPLYGYSFYESEPLDAYTLMSEPDHLKGYDAEYRDFFRKIAISEYDPLDTDNDYSISGMNDYYRTLLSTAHNGRWLMGEDE